MRVVFVMLLSLAVFVWAPVHSPSWLIIVSTTPSAPAWGQVPATAREDQAVTLKDLEGIAVVATTIRHQVIRREGRVSQIRMRNDLRVVVNSGKIDSSLTPISYTPRGVRYGKTTSRSSPIESVSKLQDFRGRDYAVWIFNDGTLTSLRTRGSAAFKQDITFSRTAEGFSCVTTGGFVRENGSGPIIIESAVDEALVLVAIISWKLVSSTCRITKQPQPLAKQ